MTSQDVLSASLIVLNWNGKEHLARCLPSLHGLDYPDYEIVVVDNGSSDGSIEYVASEFPAVTTIVNDRNLGFAGGMNAGIVRAKRDVVVLLNNDIIVRSDWLRELMHALAADSRIGIAGCKIFLGDGQTLQHAGGSISYPQALPDHYGYHQPDTGEFDALVEVDYVTFAAAAIRKTVLVEIGNLDDGLFFYYDDVDFCYRARAAGWRVVYVPTAVLTHLESATIEKHSYQYHASMHRSRLRFVLKHLSAEQIVQDFEPAEEAWLRQIEQPQERRALCRAYKAALLMAPAIYEAREGHDKSVFSSVREVTGALVRLHDQVWNQSGER